MQERDAAGNWSNSASTTFDVKCAGGEFLYGGNCTPCALGTYQSLPSLNASCTAAPIGSYIPGPGATAPVSCPANSFTSGSGVGADSLSDCLAGVDYYNDDGDAATEPLAVGVGFYSAFRDDSRTMCTNLPSNATSALYAGSGGGSNNCPVASVLTCGVGYIPNGTSCSDNSPGSMTFTNLTNHELNTLAQSNAIVVTGFDGPLTATCSGCTDIARNGVWAGATSLDGFMPGDTIAIRRNSAFSFATDVLATVTLGVTTSSNWVVTTRAAYSCNVAPWGTIAHGNSVTAYSQSNPLPTSPCSGLSESRICNDGVLSGSFAYSSCQNGCSGTPWGDVVSGYSNTAYSSTTPASSCASASQVRTCTNGTMGGSFTNTTCTNGCTGTPWGNVPHGYGNTAYFTSASDNCASQAQWRSCSNGSLSGSAPYGGCSTITYQWVYNDIPNGSSQPTSTPGTCNAGTQGTVVYTSYSAPYVCGVGSCMDFCNGWRQVFSGETMPSCLSYARCEQSW